MTEAFLAVAQATQRQADDLRLIQEFLGQIGGREIPEVLAVLEHVGQGEQGRLGAAVLAEGERRDTGDVGDVAAAQQVVQDLVLGTQHAAGLDVDGHVAGGELFHLALEGLGQLAHDGALDGVHLGVGQGYRVGHRRRADQHERKSHHENKRFLHE